VEIDKEVTLEPGKPYALITLDEQKEEYQRVANYFYMNMPSEEKVTGLLQSDAKKTPL